MSTQEETFATVFNCMDGRCQLQVNQWVREYADAMYIDTITEPGIDGILAHGTDVATLEQLQAKAAISTGVHGAQVAAVVGHFKCAGNDVSLEEHEQHVRAAMDTVSKWELFESVVGLLVNEKWEVEQVF